MSITVNNVPPTIALSGAAEVDEGSTYTLTLGAVTDPGTDTVSQYIVHWGDGTSDTYATAGDVTHVYADGDATPTITVDLVDEDGTYEDVAALSITVNNVAPTVDLAGDPDVDLGSPYTLNLSNLVDPGDDTVDEYIIDWGDGNSQTVNSFGDVDHAYAAPGDYTISVDIVDEDGTFEDVASLDMMVNDVAAEVVRIGDAPVRQYRSTPTAWEDAWSHPDVAISHKADVDDGAEAWSSITWSSRSSHTLAGGDILGDLGVSGQTVPSGYRQEIDGTEGLKFDLLGDMATRVTIDVSRMYANDDGANYEAGRLQAFDDAGNLVDEVVFSAADSGHQQQATLEAAEGFSSIVVSAGAYDDTTFVFGGYVDEAGDFTTAPYVSSSQKGSDFMLEAVEFEFGPIIALLAPAIFAATSFSSTSGPVDEILPEEEAGVVGLPEDDADGGVL